MFKAACGICCAVLLLTPPASSQDPHPVPAGTKENIIALSVDQALHGEKVSAITISVAQAPAWVRMHEEGANVPDEDGVARFGFDLLGEAPVGAEGAIIFQVADAAGQLLTTKEVLLSVAPPDRFRIVGAFPNPFSDKARVVFDLPIASATEFMVFDVLGRVVRNHRADRRPGRHEARIDGEALPAGLYVWQLVIENEEGRTVERGRLTLAR